MLNSRLLPHTPPSVERDPLPAPASSSPPLAMESAARNDGNVLGKRARSASPVRHAKHIKWIDDMAARYRLLTTATSPSQGKRKRYEGNEPIATDMKRARTEELPSHPAPDASTAPKRKRAAEPDADHNKRVRPASERPATEKIPNYDPIEVLNRLLSQAADGQLGENPFFALSAKARIIHLVSMASRGEIPRAETHASLRAYGIKADKLSPILNWAQNPDAPETDIRLGGKSADDVIDALSRGFGQLTITQSEHHLIDDASCHLILEVVEQLGDCDAKERLLATLSDHGLHTLAADAKKVAFFDRLLTVLENIAQPEIKDKAVASSHLESWYALHPALMGTARFNRLVAAAYSARDKLSDSTKESIVCRLMQPLRSLDKDADISANFRMLCGILATMEDNAAKARTAAFMAERHYFLPDDEAKNAAIGSLAGIIDTIGDASLRHTAESPMPEQDDIEYHFGNDELSW